MTGAGNEMVFDYLPPDIIDGTSTRIEAQSMYSEVKSYGESFRLGFEPTELKSFLNENGLTVLEDISAPELKPLYFMGNSVDRAVTPIFRFVHAKEAK
jgi:O-methyltransferase involved in polyketide biosynthesis